MAREVSVELYSSARPESCLGCGRGITAGDVVVPAEPVGPAGPAGRGWLLCMDCGSGLLLGQPLPAWPAGEPVPCPPEGLHEQEPGPLPDRAGGPAVSVTRRLAAMQAHPGAGPGSPAAGGTGLGATGLGATGLGATGR